MNHAPREFEVEYQPGRDIRPYGPVPGYSQAFQSSNGARVVLYGLQNHVFCRNINLNVER